MNPLKDEKDDSIVRSIQSHTKALNKFIQEANKRDIIITVMRQTKVHIVSLLLASRTVLNEQIETIKELRLKLNYTADLVCKQTAITAKRDGKIVSLEKDIKLKDIVINTLKRDKLILESLNNSQENTISKQKTRDEIIKNKPIVHNKNTDTLILEAIKRQTNVLISIHNLKNVSKDIEQITCEHPYNRVHQNVAQQ